MKKTEIKTMNNEKYFAYCMGGNSYLIKHPKKMDVIKNAKIPGMVWILPDSNNRAIVIETENIIYLQSYDTLILSLDRETGKIKKLWNGYSVTTLKHINNFLNVFTDLQFNKKSWLTF